MEAGLRTGSLASSRVNVLRALLGAVALAVLLSQSAAQARGPIRWLMAARAAAEIMKDPAASHALDSTSPFIVERRNPLQLPPSWNAVRVQSFDSYRDLSRALENGKIAAGVSAIMYDNESWNFTPAEEQNDPARYTQMAARAVHDHGLLFIAAPATDLVSVLAPGTRGGERYDKYIELRIAEGAARYADVYDIQAQGSQRNVDKFASFVQRAAAQARAVNPKIVILAGVSTNPSGQSTTAQDILRAVAATRNDVDGYWLNVPSKSPQCPRCTEFRPDIAIDVLKQVPN